MNPSKITRRSHSRPINILTSRRTLPLASRVVSKVHRLELRARQKKLIYRGKCRLRNENRERFYILSISVLCEERLEILVPTSFTCIQTTDTDADYDYRTTIYQDAMRIETLCILHLLTKKLLPRTATYL